MASTMLRGKLYHYKLLLVGAVLLAAGLAIRILADWLSGSGAEHLLVALVEALSDLLIVSGAFGVAIDFFTGKEKVEADAERTRAVLKDLTPDFTDAIVRGFAVEPADLRRVATPELLDGLATNAMALRLGDAEFAGEIYADVRDQAVRAPERWRDVQVRIRLSAAGENAQRPGLFEVLVEWEYTTVPAQAVRQFVCVSDRDEYDALAAEVPATSVWYMTPRPGLDAAKRSCFELLSFSVDGEERRIRRSERSTGQTYTVTIGEEVVREARPVRIKHVYRLLTSQRGHCLFFEVPQPARNLSLRLDYTATEVERMSVMNLVPSSRRTRVSRMPAQVDARVVSVDLPGWLLPRAGFTFVWTLLSEGAGGSREPRRGASP